MKKYLILPVILIFLQSFVPAKAQSLQFFQTTENAEHFLVFFTDKQGVDFDPHTFFHPKAIERRIRHGEDLFDPTDFPVRDDYVAALSLLVDTVDVVSRWFNAAGVFATPSQMAKVELLPFVERVEPVMLKLITAAHGESESFAPNFSQDQLELVLAHIGHLNGSWFSKNGIDGRGVRIAIFDAGFPGVDEHPAFRHIISEGRVVATRDFVRNQQHVFRSNSHGTSVMSVIGGMVDSIPMGLATGAEFLLARTETWTEYFSEEKNWLAAVEWADRLGADIINSSLGYVHHRYFPEDMDGRSSLVARAAATAFQKGILIVNAAGNEGEKDRWKIIGTPADVTEVLSVGALEHPGMLRADYSSRGPTADGRMKPNVSALGSVYAAGRNGFKNTKGTSFASPLVAGFAACVWQLNPDWTNRQVFDAIEKSARLYPYYDYAQGYGTPRADFFFRESNADLIPTFQFESAKDSLQVISLLKSLDEIGNDRHNRYVFYQFRDVDGRMLEYSVVLLKNCNVLNFNPAEFRPGQKIIVHLAGYTATWEF